MLQENIWKCDKRFSNPDNILCWGYVVEERNILDVLAEQEVLVIPKAIPLSIAGSGNSLRETRLGFCQF